MLCLRRMPPQPITSDLIHRPRDRRRLGTCRPADARLGQAFGLPTCPQSDGGQRSLFIMKTTQDIQTGAGLRVPLLTRHHRGCCPTFIPAFTTRPLNIQIDLNASSPAVVVEVAIEDRERELK